ncbi:MAG: type III pantothenate kinase [Phycisphaerales bacterium]|jgi:type III pantothenate kinase
MSESPITSQPSVPAAPAQLPGPACLIAVAVGNTRTRVGVFHHAELTESSAMPNSEIESVVAHVSALLEKLDAADDPVVVIASVKPSVSGPLVKAIKAVGGATVYRVGGAGGGDLPIHINHTLDDEGAKTVGQDRLLNALGAFGRTGQATVVVDAGTAVTVDFVDGQGTFCGGAIAPGLNMMLDSLDDHAENLPRVTFEAPPEDQPFGVNTPAAICLGVSGMIQGLVRALTERYALSYGGYPQIVATGGDLGLLEADGVIEHFVPDLQLIGIQVACARALAQTDESDAD